MHGGGGTAFKEWVERWNNHGFAAISIAVEGQTDEKDSGAKEDTFQPDGGSTLTQAHTEQESR